MKGRGAQLAFAAILGAALTVPATAHGLITLGSNLGRAPDQMRGCLPSCTFVPASLTPAAEASGGLVSPVNGAVVVWRVRVGSSSTTPTAFRVIRRLSGGLSTGAGTSATVTPPLDTTTPYPTGLPIGIGDTIGLDIGSPAGRFFVDSTGTFDVWDPPLVDGGPGQAPFTSLPSELAINADIEPTSTLANVKAKAKKGGKVRVSLETPNAGRLVAGDTTDKGVKAAAAGKKRKLLKKKIVQAPGPGPLSFVVKPTKGSKSALADGRRPKTKLKLVFTPTGGSAATQFVKVKLKA